jgi:hypothetical protein
VNPSIKSLSFLEMKSTQFWLYFATKEKAVIMCVAAHSFMPPAVLFRLMMKQRADGGGGSRTQEAIAVTMNIRRPSKKSCTTAVGWLT